MNTTQKDILKARLINIKTRSSSFWLPKLTKWMCDGKFLIDHFIADGKNEIKNLEDLNILINSFENKEIFFNEKILNQYLNSNDDVAKLISTLKSIKTFAKNEERESGKNILKIGFPFISGKLNDGSEFRTPMFFWDLEIEQKEGSNNYIWKIGEKILNHNVLSVKTSKASEMPNLKFDIDDINEAIAIYTNNGIDIDEPTFDLKSFQDVSKSEMEDIAKISLECVIGCFDVSASKLFDEIDWLDKNNHLEKLLESKVNHLFDYKKFTQDFDENDIKYYSNLDLYQQSVVKLALQQSLVIQGPPGTGKSQVIMNILLNAKEKGMKVLFVAEKKTAIDVVYNRMGDLQFSSLFIPSAKEKQLFYEQFGLIANELSNYDKLHFQDKRLEIQDILKAFSEAREMSVAKVDGLDNNVLDLLSISSNLDLIVKIKKEKLHNFDSRKISYNYFDACEEFIKDRDKVEFGLNEIILEKLDNITSKLSTNKKRVVFLKYIESGVIEKPNWLAKVKNNSIDKIIKFEAAVEYYRNFVIKHKNFKFDSDIYESNRKLFNISKNESEIKNAFSIIEYTSKVNKRIVDASKVENIVEEINEKIKEDRNKLRKESVDKIHKIYTDKYKDYDNLIRQSTLKRFRPMHEFINANYDFLFELYDIHIATIENVTTFIPLEIEKYDLVVFDEASQIFLEKGLSVIARGKRLVVAGDTKQLKPSLFFETRIEFSGGENEINYDLDEAMNAESLLDFYASRLQNIMIKGHYRSKYKELIDFSNEEFYEKQLVFVPSSEKWRKPVAVFDVDGKWENGKNIVEAEKIVEMIAFLSTQPKIFEKSIGVITFNKEQAELINGLLVKLNNQKINEWMERTIHGEFVGLFVKNIENVQGDERDIIFFSIAYNDKVRNFGPLSQSGGENRLNVAITRAREQNIVFKSLPASLYYGDASAQKGPFLFKKWLQFCEKIGKQDIADLNGDECSSIHPFIFDVKEKLEKQLTSGYKVLTNIKSSIYTMDIVIYREGRPLLAIDCDGFEGKEITSNRENDLYKQGMLNGRGWKYTKIWHVNWLENQDKQILRIINIINEI